MFRSVWIGGSNYLFPCSDHVMICQKNQQIYQIHETFYYCKSNAFISSKLGNTLLVLKVELWNIPNSQNYASSFSIKLGFFNVKFF